MALHNDLGKEAEQLAIQWLREHDYEILHANWCFGKLEIDIIARKKNKLHFIEVKSRRSNYYGYPEQSVTRSKFKNLQRASDQYLVLNPGHKWIQYDVLAITMQKNREVEYFLLEDVFL